MLDNNVAPDEALAAAGLTLSNFQEVGKAVDRSANRNLDPKYFELVHERALEDKYLKRDDSKEKKLIVDKYERWIREQMRSNSSADREISSTLMRNQIVKERLAENTRKPVSSSKLDEKDVEISSTDLEEEA